MFHLTIEVTSKVQVFTWLTLAIYALFATPDVGARIVRFHEGDPRGRRAARGVRALDWLDRFTFSSSASPLPSGCALEIVDREGHAHVGFGAFVALARCVPLLFPLWGPLALVRAFGRKS
jgi:hypothetical protein